MNTQRLANCPFCGGKAEVTDAYSVDDITWVGVCENRDGWGAHCDTREEAVEAWNKRVDAIALEQAAPAVPQPDWSQAPEWAQWWAIGPDELASWFESEPEIRVHFWVESKDEAKRRFGFGAPYIEIPLGVDWRQTLTQRPATAAGEEKQS